MEWRNRIIGYDTKPAAQFTPNPLNWRTHPSVQREALRGLLGDVGWVGAVLENKQTGNLIDGHARVEEALASDKDTPIPYLLVDLTPEEERLVLASFDPISALATADNERLEELLKDVSSSSTAVDSMLAELAKEHGVFTSDEPKDAEPQIDKAAELQQKWGTESGQLWVIGNHRLLAGDATNKADVGRLCANNRPDILHADPPYGIDLIKGESGNLGKSKRYRAIENDDKPFDPRPLLDIAPKTVLWGANHYADKLPPSPFWLVWDKQGGAKDTTFATCELAWCNESQPARVLTHIWDGFRRDSEKGEDRFHANQKPVAVIQWALSWLKGSLVADFYAGVGAGIIASENLQRACYALEKDPAYCAVILERTITAFPHLKIEKVDQARAA